MEVANEGKEKEGRSGVWYARRGTGGEKGVGDYWMQKRRTTTSSAKNARGGKKEGRNLQRQAGAKKGGLEGRKNPTVSRSVFQDAGLGRAPPHAAKNESDHKRWCGRAQEATRIARKRRHDVRQQTPGSNTTSDRSGDGRGTRLRERDTRISAEKNREWGEGWMRVHGRAERTSTTAARQKEGAFHQKKAAIDQRGKKWAAMKWERRGEGGTSTA